MPASSRASFTELMASLIFCTSVRESCVGILDIDGELDKEGALESEGEALGVSVGELLGIRDDDGELDKDGALESV